MDEIKQQLVLYQRVYYAKRKGRQTVYAKEVKKSGLQRPLRTVGRGSLVRGPRE